MVDQLSSKETDVKIAIFEEIEYQSALSALNSISNKPAGRKQTQFLAGDNSIFFILGSPGFWAAAAVYAYPIWNKIIEKVGDKVIDEGINKLWERVTSGSPTQKDDKHNKFEELFIELEKLREKRVEVAAGVDTPLDEALRDGMYYLNGDLREFAETAAFLAAASEKLREMTNKLVGDTAKSGLSFAITRHSSRELIASLYSPNTGNIEITISLLTSGELQTIMSINQVEKL